MKQTIGHLDSDCFYVSAERVRFPALRKIPVGVRGNQGACVIAKSYELKAAGVKTGMPIWDARKLCPDAVFVKRDFRWYEVLSRKMLDVLADVSPLVEYYSIDEMFFEASELPRVFGGSMQQATETLQQRMKVEVGVPVSIGIARSKTMAKLGSDTAKPYGVRVLHDLTDAERRAFLIAIPVGELCGVGRKSEQKLAAHGITNCRQFIEAKSSFIQKLLTITGGSTVVGVAGRMRQQDRHLAAASQGHLARRQSWRKNCRRIAAARLGRAQRRTSDRVPRLSRSLRAETGPVIGTSQRLWLGRTNGAGGTDEFLQAALRGLPGTARPFRQPRQGDLAHAPDCRKADLSRIAAAHVI
ncbi:MAG TPA: hypothetical protein VMM56_15075 [Planctomycetaceae bacterium]|nr:hypothetical protein [Planctomycetaceae bacterium]